MTKCPRITTCTAIKLKADFKNYCLKNWKDCYLMKEKKQAKEWYAELKERQ